VSECHSEAQPKNLLFRKPLEKHMLRFRSSMKALSSGCD
jgi:hypothetical protein